MSSTVTAFAHAKLNFGLRVVGVRDDGYHLLDSVFVPIDLADRIELDLDAVEIAAEPEALRIDFEIDYEPGLPGATAVGPSERNLAVRAARSYCEAAGLGGRLGVRLHKAIPVGAGLGGGSSDAGTVLRVLDARFPGRVSGARLSEMAVRLGADVPFFLRGVPSRVGGIGEEISPLRDFPRCGILLANPGVSLSTAEVFAAFDSGDPALTLAASGSTMRPLDGPGAAPRDTDSLSRTLISGLSLEGDGHQVLGSGLLANDLEPFAATLCPSIGELQERIRKLGARETAMSGSGATVYGVFATEHEARSALEQAEFESPVWACATRTLGEPKQQP